MDLTLKERIEQQLDKLNNPSLTEDERRAVKDNVAFLQSLKQD